MATSSDPILDFGSPQRAFWGGAWEGLGIPAFVLFISYVGFGVLIREMELPIWFGLLSTFSAWALPGQIALVELSTVGASMLVIFLAVFLTNARLLPMVAVFIPYIRGQGTASWKYYGAAFWIAVTAWLLCMKRCPDLPENQRLSFFVGFSSLVWSGSIVGTAVGYMVPDLVPKSVTLGLVFINPIYFLVMFAGNLANRAWAYALGIGGVLGPALHLVSPDWGLLITGLVAGTAAYFIDQLVRARNG
ncbi:MAG: AzlC family ABC transporter permease [Rhodospirillaceae bacterium]|jgi:predicted branched-subunit amino acid permease|nr:AzlC family ABC transporter permease [Rhodospirillales bacterium]MBT3906497.1 AzlC family ABC transporter permease [Rhodospirillaceae bacterium]MBT4701541.1 AzlC family ABC transporter permease [Rhodospirillaceae bacterium]MBT5034058.1 AzlC family ABC transporter permease [Rhodospirillaceae bacterium]MBT6218844.1 AzlC family ABC transporter permease [Rhodospirillaceae bacterium]